MNERINELAEQAKEVVFSAPMTGREISQVDLGKFAELIIRECANICELDGQSYKYSFTPAKARLAESTSKHCGELIKRYFGVEE